MYSHDFLNYSIPTRKEYEAPEIQGVNIPHISEKGEAYKGSVRLLNISNSYWEMKLTHRAAQWLAVLLWKESQCLLVCRVLSGKSFWLSSVLR